MALYRLSLREMQKRPVRTLLTLLSIIIGSGAIVATAISSRSAQLAQVAMVEAVTGKASLEIQAAGGAPLEAKELTFLGDIPGIDVISPALRRFSMMTVKSGPSQSENQAGNAVADTAPPPEKIEPQKFRVQLLGVNLLQDQQVRGTEVVEGASFDTDESANNSNTSSTDVWIDAGFANASGVVLGDEVSLLTRSGIQTARIAGLVKAHDASSSLQSAVVIAPIRTIQRWTRSQGRLDVVQLVIRDEKQVEAIQAAVAAKLPEGVSVRPPTLRSQVAGESTTAIQRGLLIATLFALVLAAFIIFNTFQMNVGERKRQLGILRALGTTRRQVLWMILREGIFLGVIGSGLGCVAGTFGASVLNQSTAALLQIEIPHGSFSWLPIAIAMTCGVTVSALGALIPAIMAAYTSPADAMKVVSGNPIPISLWFWFVMGWVSIVVGCFIQWIAAIEIINIQAGTVGVVMIVLGVVLLLPATLKWLTQWAAAPLMPWFGVETRLARRQILRNPGRSSMTIGILLVAMAMGLGMASTILDNIRDVQSWYNRSIVGDFFVRAAMPDMSSGNAADMPIGFADRVKAIDGVAVVDTLRFVSARSDINSVIVVVRQFTSPTQDYFDLIEGTDDDVMRGIRSGEVVLGSVLSERTQLHRGDRIELETAEGKRELAIVGVTNEYLAGGLTIYMESDQAKKLLNVEGADAVIVKAEPAKLKQVEASLRTMAESEGLMFQSFADIAQLIENMINNVVGGLWAVLALGTLIAAFGLINTLAMNILEQTREIGMLRVVAMTRSQVRRMVLAQAMIMSLIGIVPGVLLGIGISSAMNLTTMVVTGHAVKFQLYPGLMVAAVVIEFVVVFLAAFVPAERAARLNLAAALQYE